MYRNYAKLIPEEFRDITCPEPMPEEYAIVKQEQESRAEIKKEKKEGQKKMKKKLEEVAFNDSD